MSLVMQHHSAEKYVEINATGKLTSDDYAQFVPNLETLIREHGKIRILFVLHDFHGWSAAALWEDLKFDVKHFRDVERLAIVGETRWQKGMANFCRPFTTAEIRYFEHNELENARKWLSHQGNEAQTPVTAGHVYQQPI